MNHLENKEEIWIENAAEVLQERYELAISRIREIREEHFGEERFEQYFAYAAEFLLKTEGIRRDLEECVTSEACSAAKRAIDYAQKYTLAQLLEKNHALYEDVLPEHYEESYANPAYAVRMLGEGYGQLLSFLYVEMRSLIGFVFEGKLWEMVIRAELFVEMYSAFVYEWQENRKLPKQDALQRIVYWFASDYADVAAENRTRELVVPEDNFAVDIICGSDLTDERYLFAYGEYVTENELKMARFMAALPQETVNTMADTYTEGYRIGFEVTGKDLTKKKTAEIRYQLGFERMMKRAVENFAGMDIKPVVHRAASSILYNPMLDKIGFFGANPNRQCDFDHKDDKALLLDKNYVNRKLEVSRTAFEKYKEEARGYAGPAVLETFGEKGFDPVNKPEAVHMTEEQNRLWVDFRSQSGEIQREYILEEERSFTIIAFPVPEIGENFEEIFRETIRINTLDYKLYQGIQQTIIDALDTADFCELKGMNGNQTDLRVNLYKLQKPESETIFENCVADVNIPVGEVFTSPVLKGTEGVLHVSRVFLNGLEYRDLSITFADGMISDYSCGNFQTEAENRDFVRENILFRHKTLPLGEFAIGTNTTAYAAAKKFGIEDKFPILIAEKTGPHFAVGDTCYSHCEDMKTYNPDGKEIVARDNEISLLRTTKPAKAYFNCHTDITIPYDELGELTAVGKDGTRIRIIEKGRFVLPGTESLNEALDCCAN